MKYSSILSCFLFFNLPILNAQTITNVTAKQDGDKVLVTYNLQCEGTAQIELFISEKGDDVFTGPLNNVSVDVGYNIASGNKSIIWDPLKEKDMIVGENVVFRVVGHLGGFIDNRDGKSYKSVKIGDQIWMADNLSFKSSTGCWAYEKNEKNVEKYGYLYSWSAANSACPEGWHLPSASEWTKLLSFLGGESVAGGRLKETGTENWDSPNTDAKNDVGFSARPGGYRMLETGGFDFLGVASYWWASDEGIMDDGWLYAIVYKSSSITMIKGLKNNGFSVRCVKNE